MLSLMGGVRTTTKRTKGVAMTQNKSFQSVVGSCAREGDGPCERKAGKAGKVRQVTVHRGKCREAHGHRNKEET
jgi:hypothetical protein